MKQIQINIGPDGKIGMDAQGFTGNSCEQATQELQRILAGTTISDDKKSDYYQTDNVHDTNRMRF